jgi:stress-induced morphogen
VKIDDLSDGCGQKFELLIVSPKWVLVSNILAVSSVSHTLYTINLINFTRLFVLLESRQLISLSCRFDGMSLVDRSRAVHETLAEEIKVLFNMNSTAEFPNMRAFRP